MYNSFPKKTLGDTYTVISISGGGYRETAPEVVDLRRFRKIAEKNYYTIIEIRKNNVNNNPAKN